MLVCYNKPNTLFNKHSMVHRESIRSVSMFNSSVNIRLKVAFPEILKGNHTDTVSANDIWILDLIFEQSIHTACYYMITQSVNRMTRKFSVITKRGELLHKKSTLNSELILKIECSQEIKNIDFQNFHSKDCNNHHFYRTHIIYSCSLKWSNFITERRWFKTFGTIWWLQCKLERTKLSFTKLSNDISDKN